MALRTGDRAAWLKGPASTCNGMGEPPERPWRLVLLGAPGTGKGTQAELLNTRLGACQLSTGDVFRTAKKLAEESQSPALGKALEVMHSGGLVHDETVVGVVAERYRCLRCAHGMLLDGFPRTVAQAMALDAMAGELEFALDAVINYSLDDAEIVRRLSGRRTCMGCGRTYHVEELPPHSEGVCDACSGVLVQRSDDRPEAITVRLAAYHSATAPLVEYYETRDLLIHIDANGTPSEIFHRTLVALGVDD